MFDKQSFKPEFSLAVSLFLILLLPYSIVFLFSAPSAGILWDWANALGYSAVGICLWLFIYSGRSHYHRDIGYLALLLIALHILLLLINEPLLIEHLKLSAPWYMLSGLAAVVLMALLVISSLAQFRTPFWSSYAVFQQSHKWLSISICMLIGLHLMGSNYYLNGVWVKVFLALITLVIVVYYLHDRNYKMINAKQKVVPGEISVKQILLMLAILSITIWLLVTVTEYRKIMIIEAPTIDIAFEHIKHKAEPCATCHHNYVDGSSGSGGCYDCHKYSAATNLHIEATFHKFCANCHIKKAQQQLDSGPLRQCSLCHIDDQIID